MGDGRDQLSNGNGLGPGFPGVGARQEVDLGPYIARLKQQVKQQWHPVLFHSSSHTIIGFSISRTGQISDVRILKPSGSTLTDQAELQAIQQAAPFAPLPEGYQAAELDITFNFNQIEY
jgi:TonB family protein